jgi:hypothetical protein
MTEKIAQPASGATLQGDSAMESAFDTPQTSAPARMRKPPANLFAVDENETTASAPAGFAAGGLPMQLKLGIEQLAGVSMEGVSVHYSSAEPAKIHAHAYAEGADIYLAPGQEAHLPHEAWHVAQQRLGKVKPNVQLAGKSVNIDPAFEAEATKMGAKAMQARIDPDHQQRIAQAPVQGAPVAQGMLEEFLKLILTLISLFGVLKALAMLMEWNRLGMDEKKMIEASKTETKKSLPDSKSVQEQGISETQLEEVQQILEKAKVDTPKGEDTDPKEKQPGSKDKDKENPKLTELKKETRIRRAGDCLYTAANDALGNEGNNEDAFREIATTWLIDNYATSDIRHYASLDALISVVSTPQAWAGNAGDFSPVVLAFALGIELHIVTPGGTYVYNRGGAGSVAIYHADNHFTAEPIDGVHDKSSSTTTIVAPLEKQAPLKEKEIEPKTETRIDLPEKESCDINAFSDEQVEQLKSLQTALRSQESPSKKVEHLLLLVEKVLGKGSILLGDYLLLYEAITPKKEDFEYIPEEIEEVIEAPEGYTRHTSETNQQDCYISDPRNLIEEGDLRLAIDHLIQGGNSHHRTKKVDKSGFQPDFENRNIFYLHIGKKGARLYLVTFVGNHRDGRPKYLITRKGNMSAGNMHRF